LGINLLDAQEEGLGLEIRSLRWCQLDLFLPGVLPGIFVDLNKNFIREVKDMHGWTGAAVCVCVSIAPIQDLREKKGGVVRQ